MKNKIDWPKWELRSQYFFVAAFVIGMGALIIKYLRIYFQGEWQSWYILNLLLFLLLMIVNLRMIFKMNRELKNKRKNEKEADS